MDPAAVGPNVGERVRRQVFGVAQALTDVLVPEVGLHDPVVQVEEDGRYHDEAGEGGDGHPARDPPRPVPPAAVIRQEQAAQHLTDLLAGQHQPYGLRLNRELLLERRDHAPEVRVKRRLHDLHTRKENHENIAVGQLLQPPRVTGTDPALAVPTTAAAGRRNCQNCGSAG